MDMTDVLIIGAGPAGLNAALYAARKELTVTVVAKDIGGQMLLTSEIENYLGIPSISGFELADRMEKQVRQYPVDIVYAGVKSLTKDGDGYFTAHLDDGKELRGKTCIVTAGKHSRTLGIPGEKEYTGRGVSYCATCDAMFYRKKTVAIVGGGDSAVQAAIEMAKLCPKVYLVVRSRIRAQEILVKRMNALDNVALPLDLRGEKNSRERAAEFLNQVGLAHRHDHLPSELSGGEQQRVALARAFANRPAYLFADEPTGNLDGQTGAHISNLLFDLNQQHGTTLVLVTHDENLAQRCQRQLRLANGRLVAA